MFPAFACAFPTRVWYRRRIAPQGLRPTRGGRRRGCGSDVRIVEAEAADQGRAQHLVALVVGRHEDVDARKHRERRPRGRAHVPRHEREPRQAEPRNQLARIQQPRKPEWHAMHGDERTPDEIRGSRRKPGDRDAPDPPLTGGRTGEIAREKASIRPGDARALNRNRTHLLRHRPPRATTPDLDRGIKGEESQAPTRRRWPSARAGRCCLRPSLAGSGLS